MSLGPFKINGVPLRRVDQSYVIGTSTKVDISGVGIHKLDDKYFGKVAEKKNKKAEGEFLEAEKEVYQEADITIKLEFVSFVDLPKSETILDHFIEFGLCRRRRRFHKGRKMTRRQWMQL